MSLTLIQQQKFTESLKKYRKKYLIKKNEELDESATRIMVNALLCDVLGYEELSEVKTEYAIRGTYVDYLVQTKRKTHFLVEVKAIQLNLSEKHLRQAVGYGANEGVDWVMLTNGKCIELYRIIFGKPVKHKKVFEIDLSDLNELKMKASDLSVLTKILVEKKELDDYWKRFTAQEPKELAKELYDLEVVRFLKKRLKSSTKMNFSEDDILDSLHKIITTKIESTCPTMKKLVSKKEKRTKR